MNDLTELKRFVVAHAISQNLPADHYGALLDRITADAGDEPGSWPYEWIRAGDEWDAAGETALACQYYTMGRFPYVDGPGRKRALARCLDAFDRWRSGVPGLEPVVVDVDGVPVRVWAAGLSAEEPRPLLVMTGGIVSPKEQWGPVLPQIAAFGMAGVVADLPGVGESPLRYGPDAWRLFPAILDALEGRAEVRETYLLALSFSGHAAITAALRDPRVRGVVANGPPVHDFFTDAAWQARVPKVTRDTLAHLVGVPPEAVFAHVRDWALDDADLRALTVPLAAVTAKRDEIIPPGDTERLKRSVRDLRLMEHDDVHGAPSHLAETRVWSLLAVQRMRPGADPEVTASLAAALEAARAGAAA
ncbi:alpha/beta hydrolase [Microbispora triticiradicis]|uniref:Alpha/beta hydrolase n=1 Tax=Microbispora triticiradicis TaxID=2200763 RepID=A0ABX9LK33_9ACTN|nr:alpha/beta hydrolase [Microbispora triticiradicis]RGA03958.1 alpha/beta hydrolase [Microbispora triticiradicis]